MNINTIIAICGVSSAVGGLGFVLYANRQLKKARDLNKETLKVTKEATAALVGGLAEKLARGLFPQQREQIIGVESIQAAEFFEALNAADLPTPGCGCEECDARRLRRAAAKGGES